MRRSDSALNSTSRQRDGVETDIYKGPTRSSPAYRAAMVAGFGHERRSLDDFAQDVVMIWGGFQYAEFQGGRGPGPSHETGA